MTIYFYFVKKKIFYFQRLIVCLEESIYIFNMRDNVKLLHTIRDVPSNPDGLCALSSNDTNPYLAYPGSSITGEIQIFDTNNLVSNRYNLRFKLFIL
jgi:autophagy-related protein 18